MNEFSVFSKLKQAINSVEDKFDKALEVNTTPTCTVESHKTLQGDLETALAKLKENSVPKKEIAQEPILSDNKFGLLKRIAELETRNNQLQMRNEELLFSLEDSTRPLLQQIASIKSQKDKEIEWFSSEIRRLSHEVDRLNNELRRLTVTNEQIDKQKKDQVVEQQIMDQLQIEIETLKYEKMQSDNKLKQVELKFLTATQEAKKKSSFVDKESQTEYFDYEKALKLIGSKTEEIMELKADIADMKEVYKCQLSELLDEIARLRKLTGAEVMQ